MNTASESRVEGIYLGKADCGKCLQLLFLECQERSGFTNSARCDIRRGTRDANPPDFAVKTALQHCNEAPS